MSDFETVDYQVQDRVAMILLNRPKQRNAFNKTLRLELRAALERADADDDVRVIVLSGAGKGFCAGADLTDGMGGFSNVEDQIQEEYKPFLMQIRQSTKLHIAAVNGAAAGIGFALAMSCDLVMMAEDAYIYQAFAAIGLIPDGGATYHLLQGIGPKRAMQLIVEAGRMQAQECVDAGLANKLVPGDALLAEAQAWAAQLAKGSPLSQRYSKQALIAAQSSDLEGIIDLEAKLQRQTTTSKDFVHAVQAFFQKKEPEFKGV